MHRVGHQPRAGRVEVVATGRAERCAPARRRRRWPPAPAAGVAGQTDRHGAGPSSGMHAHGCIMDPILIRLYPLTPPAVTLDAPAQGQPMTHSAEARARELGLVIPDYSDPPYGGRYGSSSAGVPPHRRPARAQRHHPGVPRAVSFCTRKRRRRHHPRTGPEAARYTAVNALGMIRLRARAPRRGRRPLTRALLRALPARLHPAQRGLERRERSAARRLRPRRRPDGPRLASAPPPSLAARASSCG